MAAESQGLTAVLGASSGVGAALVERLLADGRDVLGYGRRRFDRPGYAEQAIDVRHRSSVVEALTGTSAPVDAVVNCVAVGFFAPWDSDHEVDWEEMAATNVAGLANVLSVVATLEPAPLTYLHVGSLAAHRPSASPGNAVYTATKVAARSMVTDFRHWSRRAGRRTRVMTVSPSLIEGTDFDTNFFRSAEQSRQPLFDRPHLGVHEIVSIIVSVLDLPAPLEVSDLVLRHQEQED